MPYFKTISEHEEKFPACIKKYFYTRVPQKLQSKLDEEFIFKKGFIEAIRIAGRKKKIVNKILYA